MSNHLFLNITKLHELSPPLTTMTPFSLLLLLLLSFSITTSASSDTTNVVILKGTSTLLSENNNTFELGFFSPDSNSHFYLAIRYFSIPTSPQLLWVANRDKPITNFTSSTTLQITNGNLVILSPSNLTLFHSSQSAKASSFKFLDTGNLVLLSEKGELVWQSFDFPTDTWLPGMNLTKDRFLTSWRSSNDPSPGLYSLRLDPKGFNQFQLVYNNNGLIDKYWSTGNWTGFAFSDVPQMLIPYIYKFHFADPLSPIASFWYTVTALDGAVELPLTRFRVDVDGLLKQYTWSHQIENWNMFWSQPENPCRVYGLCGNLGVCKGSVLDLKSCGCLSGFSPVNGGEWESGDFSGGCGREESGSLCEESDGFERVGVVEFDGAFALSFDASRSVCESTCLRNCSCVGLFHDERTNLCKNVYGPLLNLRNLSIESMIQDVLYVRVPKDGVSKNGRLNFLVLVCSIVGSVAVLVLVLALTLFFILGRRRRNNGKGVEEDGTFPVLNLKVFTYKELYAATRGFSDKLGHGGFGAVFEGRLPDSTPVAVKRLERPGSGEKEFRAEVCTIGNIQHVNLVRLRGFCSENSHRLLVYDYMPNGPLSAYLRRDGPILSWDVRFRVAVGTARGIAYLHEECRDCIIHCDIKPENILLDGDNTAKVSDFGLAKLVGRDFSRVLATMRGTWGYVAPEWISGVAITTKADVYSYGMTLLELLGGRRNVEAPPSAGANGCEEGEKGEKWFFPPYAAQQITEGNVAVVVDDRLGSAYNVEEAQRVAMVAIWCIQDNEETRPTMRMVVKMLEGVVEVTNPPPPKLLQALISGESYHGVQIDSGNVVSTNADCSVDNAEVSNYSSFSSPGNLSLPVNQIVNV